MIIVDYQIEWSYGSIGVSHRFAEIHDAGFTSSEEAYAWTKSEDFFCGILGPVIATVDDEWVNESLSQGYYTYDSETVRKALGRPKSFDE